MKKEGDSKELCLNGTARVFLCRENKKSKGLDSEHQPNTDVTAATLDTRVPLLRWRRRIAHPVPRPAGHKRARALLRMVCAT